MKRIHYIALIGIAVMAAGGCTSMRYETFDSGLEPDADPYTDEEVALRETLWDGAVVVEDFEDALLEPPLQHLVGLETVEIEDGLVHGEPGQHSVIFSIDLSGPEYSSVTFCAKSAQGVYVATKVGPQGHIIEPHIFLDPGHTNVSVWSQQDDSFPIIYRSERSYTNEWFVLELKDTPEGIAFNLNGDHLVTADVHGHEIATVTFNGIRERGSALVDYVILK